MAPIQFPTSLRTLALLLLMWLRIPAAFGQSAPPAPRGYDFLTVLTVESSIKAYAKILITPAIQGKSEIALADMTPHYPSSEKSIAAIMQNTTTINQTLSEVTTAGWELFQVYPLAANSGTGSNPTATRYLFRKAKN